MVVQSEVDELGGSTVKWIPGTEHGGHAAPHAQAHAHEHAEDGKWSDAAALLDAALAEEEEAGDFDTLASKRPGGSLLSATANLANTSACCARRGGGGCRNSPPAPSGPASVPAA